MFRNDPAPARPGTTFALILFCLCLAVAICFRTPLLSNLEIGIPDRTDIFIQVALLEHWYNVFRGFSAWNNPGYFYPTPKVLGYNDGYFIYGVLHAVFRSLGADIFVAMHLVNIIVKATGFLALYALLRGAFRAPVGWALFGAFLFTINNASYLRSNHAQLLSVAFAPLFWLLLWRFCRALLQSRPLPVMAGWGCATALFMAAWLMTAYYMAWFTCMFTLVAALCVIVARGRQLARLGPQFGPSHAIALAIVGGVAVLALMPFLSVYLAKARETGMHGIVWALNFSPHWYDVINVSPRNLIYGPAYFAAYAGLCDGCAGIGVVERMTGITPALLVMLIVALVWLCAGRRDRRRWLLAPLAVTVLVTWLAVLRFGDAGLWPYIYTYIPGAAAIRVPARYQIFIALPVVMLVTITLWRLRLGIAPKLLIAALLLVSDLIEKEPGLSRTEALARLAVPPPPANCRSFFTTAAPDQTDTIYPHNVDAMMIAELHHIPAINGFSSFQPPGWNFADPNAPDYLQRVTAYVKANKLSGVCELDLTSKRWSSFSG